MALDPEHSLILQAWNMGERFDDCKDAIITPMQSEWTSLPLFPRSLAFLEPFTKAPLWLHGVTWIPLTFYGWFHVIPKHTLGTYCVFFFGLTVVWPLLEYLLHRFLFHIPVAWAKGNGVVNVARLLLHTIHHAHPKDRMRVITPLPMSVGVATLIFPCIFAMVNRDDALALCCGIVWGFMLYDATHYYLHFGAPSSLPDYCEPVKKWLKTLHKAHANHHYAQNGSQESFGVSHMIYDEIFRTLSGDIDKKK